MEQVGYKVIYDPTVPVTQTDFTQNVIAMKNAGVKILFIDQMPAELRLGHAEGPAPAELPPPGHPGRGHLQQRPGLGRRAGRSAVDGAYLRPEHLALPGRGRPADPGGGDLPHWVQMASPGFKPDLFTLYGWLSAELFAQALKNAGSNPSRGSLLQALSKITSFSGNNIIAPNDPAAKTVGNCYLLGQVTNGQFQRLDDPPVDSSTNGYRCDYKYIRRRRPERPGPDHGGCDVRRQGTREVR